MKKYHIEYAEVAEKDIDSLFNVIVNDYKSPITAFRYIDGLIHTINELCRTGDIYANCTSKSVEKYGQNLKRINYKKMAIFYSIYEEIVYIHRIIPSSIVADL